MYPPVLVCFALLQYIHMVSEEEIEEQVAAQKHLFARGVIHPLDRRCVDTLFTICGWNLCVHWCRHHAKATIYKIRGMIAKP